LDLDFAMIDILKYNHNLTEHNEILNPFLVVVKVVGRRYSSYSVSCKLFV